MIRCKHCGTSNPLDRVLCVDCGRKLDFNDPSLLESGALPQDFEQQAPPLSPQAKRFRLEKPDYTGKMISLFLIFILFLGIFFVLQTGHVPEKDLRLPAARSLDRKLSRLDSPDQSVYVTLNNDEINIFIERRLAPCREDLTAMKPGFLRFQKAFAELGRYDMALHLKYLLFKRPIFFTLRGTLRIRESRFTLELHHFSVGRLRLPLRFAFFLFHNEAEYLDRHASFEVPSGMSSIKINQKILSAFSSGSPDASGKTAPGDSRILDKKLPDDVLLIQAADHYFSRERYTLARKYYSLALIRFPNSPLKDHASSRLKLCSNTS